MDTQNHSLGTIVSINAEHENQTGLIRIQWEEDGFAQAGDSGALVIQVRLVSHNALEMRAAGILTSISNGQAYAFPIEGYFKQFLDDVNNDVEESDEYEILCK